MLTVCRDSSENTHFLVKGLNLGFRECPYVLLINLSDLERRFDNVLSNRDRDGFKAMLRENAFEAGELAQLVAEKGVARAAT